MTDDERLEYLKVECLQLGFRMARADGKFQITMIRTGETREEPSIDDVANLLGIRGHRCLQTNRWTPITLAEEAEIQAYLDQLPPGSIAPPMIDRSAIDRWLLDPPKRKRPSICPGSPIPPKKKRRKHRH